ncbi:MAG: nickel pincer cofactor biosynthesis protein LarB [Verrucomicrobiota bacterium JB023]|nr:nickel pincer cofactor biosynthesis protein LarB [Verrucomicrobiota bacterium JB023]
MNRADLQTLLTQIANGKRSPEDALEILATLPLQELSHSTLDLHRELRTGTPEVIFGENKTADQIADNLLRLNQAHGKALATRVSSRKARHILNPKDGPPAPDSGLSYHRSARILARNLPDKIAPSEDKPFVSIVTAGTSDLTVAEEAALTLQYLEHPFIQITDIGVAGLHRLFPHLETLRRSTAIIAVAGMEGALPSVLAGLVPCPLIAVPTSVGYGTARNGETTLHAMLTSCASGLAVVNIDNGFGAALFAHKLLSQI